MPPHRRDIGIVFQHYALFRHKTVFENVEFGLRVRRVATQERARRTRQALELVRLDGLERRYPRKLSGGQQQRVAIARAVVINPTVLLLDEPLSNLDAKLRVSTREELRRLQRELGVTTIFVTHDQEEALTVADRVAVMQLGRLEQVGAPEELYARPATVFVGGFVGASTQFQGRMVEGDPRCALVQLADAAITLHAERPERGGPADVGSTVVAVVRPEHVSVRDPGEPTGDPNVFEGRVLSRTFVGAITRYRIQLEGGPVVLAETPNTGARRWEADERVRVSWSARHTVLVAGR